jgi:hypothetical protein
MSGCVRSGDMGSHSPFEISHSQHNFKWTILYIVLCYDNFVLVCFRFRIDNTDHIIDVNKGNIPFEYDQVNIICPVYMPGTHEEDAEKYIIYNVSGSVSTYASLIW